MASEVAKLGWQRKRSENPVGDGEMWRYRFEVAGGGLPYECHSGQMIGCARKEIDFPTLDVSQSAAFEESPTNSQVSMITNLKS